MLDKFNNLKNETGINKNYIYLIEQTESSSGFYLHNEKLLFISRDFDGNNNGINNVKTDYLELIMGVRIKAISNDPDFEEGNFNILTYNGNYSHEEVDVFISICNLYLENKEYITFFEFFQLIRNLFNKTNKRDKLDVLGLFGELAVIYFAFNKFNVNLSKYWHINGLFSKYDFVIEDIPLEIKTSTTGHQEFKIKHDQIFGTENVYLGTVTLIHDETGITIKDLVEKIRSIPEFNRNLKFVVNLEKSLLNIIKTDDDKYLVNDIRFYDTSKLDSIEIIADGINDISYSYNFSNKRYIDEKEFYRIVNKSIK